MTLAPRLFSRVTFGFSRIVTVGIAKPATWGFAESSAFCAAPSVLSLSPVLEKIACATASLMLAAAMPDPASAVSKLMGIVSPAFGECGPVTTSSPFAPRCRAAIALKRRPE